MANRRPGQYDFGAIASGHSEAEIVMVWANELRAELLALGHKVVRTRVDAKDSAPLNLRADIAKAYFCDVLVSLHCNAFDNKANGTETFYRGEANKAEAKRINSAVVAALGTRDRGVKTEEQSQHTRLAILNFPRAFLIELGFMDNKDDLERITDPAKRKATCQALAKVLTGQ